MRGRRPLPRLTVAGPYSAGMIEQLEGMPPGTLGFRAAGHITREDYSGLLVPALQAAVEGGAPLRTLYLIEDMKGIEPSALAAPTRSWASTSASGTTTGGSARRSSPTWTGSRTRRGCSRG